MTVKKNGWRLLALVASAVVAVAGALAVLKPYVPWAPVITFALATENTLARFDNQLITLLTLEAQAKAAKDWDQARRLRVLILNKEREIKDIEKLKAK